MRALHNLFAIIVFLPLTITATTGILYQFCKLWLAIPKHELSWLMKLHQLSVIGIFGKFLYAPLLISLVLFMILTGLWILTGGFSNFSFSWKPWSTDRGMHYNLSIILFLPLATVALCGGLYRLLSSWFGIKIRLLLDLHTGSIGFNLEYVFPIFFGITLLIFAYFGIKMNTFVKKFTNQASYV